MKRYKNVSMLPIAFGIACMFSGVSYAADNAKPVGASASGALEEVIITARKTEESAQVVPVSVKAFSAGDIEKKAILSIRDLTVPGVFISTNSQGGYVTFAIRAAKADIGTSDTVTTYIGDVPVASTVSVGNMMYDMQSISVLKGPQGTLFGANSTGGAIIFRPNMPTDKFEGYIDVGIGNYNRSSVQGMINWPISDTVQLRVAAEGVNQEKGFYHNVNAGPVPNLFPLAGNALSANKLFSGYNGIREYGNDKHESARVILRIKPNAQLQNDFEYDYFHEDDQKSQTSDILTYLRPAAGYTAFGQAIDFAAYGITVPTGNNLRLAAIPTWTKHKVNNYIDTLTYDISDRASLKAVLAFQDISLDTSQQSGSVPVIMVDGRFKKDIKKWTFEPSLDLKSEDGRFRNKVGLFFSDMKWNNIVAYSVLDMPWAASNSAFVLNNFLQPVLPQSSNGFNTQQFKSHAIYNQASYDLTKELTVSLGLRYTWDRGNYTNTSHTLNAGVTAASWTNFIAHYGDPFAGNCTVGNIQYYSSVNLAACTAGETFKTQAPSFNLTLEDRFNDRSMIYATLRGGYLVGGFNNGAQPPVTGMQTTFKPEKVVDFETGLKSDWELWGRPIRTNLAVFYGNYKDQQRVQNGTTPTGQTFVGVANAGSSSFYGFDFDGTYEVTDNLELSAAWNHIETEYTKFNAIINVPGVFAFADLSGKPMSQTPRDQVNLSATLTWPLSSAVGVVKSTLGYSWTDKTDSRDSPTYSCTPNASGQCFGPSSPALDFSSWDKLPAYDIWNFTTSWKGIMGSNFDANFWVKNLMDKKYYAFVNNQLLQFGYVTRNYGAPRTFGLNVKYSF